MTQILLEAPKSKNTKGITPAERRPRRKRLPCAPGELEEVVYIYNPCFDDPKAAKSILGPMPDQEEYEQKCAEIRVPKSVTPELIGAYLYPLLSREQEAHLFRKMNYYKHLAEKARIRVLLSKEGRVAQSILQNDTQEYHRNLALAVEIQKLLVASNQRLVYGYVRKMGLTGNEFFEATQDAMFPLINSVLKFDYAKGNRLNTYATYALMNWKARYCELFYRRATTNVDDQWLIAMAGTEMDEEVEETDIRCCQRSLINTVFSKLDDREQKIVKLRVGLGPVSPQGKKEWTLDEVGREVGITKERVRQIQVRAYKKMRELKPLELERAKGVLARLASSISL